jgi:hypothetical protein
MDASPAKAWLVGQRNNPEWARHYALAFAKRPREELYVLGSDPQQVNNVASDPKFAEVRAQLERQLMDELRRVEDPRVLSDDPKFEHPPFTGPVNDGKRTPAGADQSSAPKKKGKKK